MWGQLPAVEGSIVERALVARAEQLPDEVDGVPRAGGSRKADALAATAQDSLSDRRHGSAVGNAGSEGDGVNPAVTIFVDATSAGAHHGEAGAEIALGPRVGPATLERILCEGTVQVVAVSDGRSVASSSTSRAIPPALRRFVT
jgi:hypothetical protein